MLQLSSLYILLQDGIYVLYSYCEHFQNEYTTLNPNQCLPTLVVEGYVLSESGAILEFLKEAHQAKPLLRLTSLLAQLATEDFSAEQRAAKKQQWGRYWIERGFQALKTSSVKAAEIY
ncbi:unnamed protein product [Peronospora destructor]|uniref:GST N-terminal domain-containing protein n=1 Tax=Peronospora destructor TaxID=86335 RepID=A0AAV0V522_9STRA|nr:unnamed protein product [Peronospora destructor]